MLALQIGVHMKVAHPFTVPQAQSMSANGPSHQLRLRDRIDAIRGAYGRLDDFFDPTRLTQSGPGGLRCELTSW
jgi:hypothetical protein